MASESQKSSENGNARDLASVLRLAFRRKWLEQELMRNGTKTHQTRNFFLFKSVFLREEKRDFFYFSQNF